MARWYRPVMPLPATKAAGSVPDGWRDYVAAYSGFLGLQLIDLLSTFAVLWLGGTEGNPHAAGVIERSGITGLVGLKVSLVLMTALFWVPAVQFIAQQKPAVRRWAFPVVNGLVLAATVYYCVIVVRNLGNLSILLEAREAAS